jgi:hypothetical protein
MSEGGSGDSNLHTRQNRLHICATTMLLSSARYAETCSLMAFSNAPTLLCIESSHTFVADWSEKRHGRVCSTRWLWRWRALCDFRATESSPASDTTAIVVGPCQCVAKVSRALWTFGRRFLRHIVDVSNCIRSSPESSRARLESGRGTWRGDVGFSRPWQAGIQK